jgi:putative endonuclease
MGYRGLWGYRDCRPSFETRRSAAPQDEDECAGNGGAKMTEGAFLYILRCSDGSYYIGTTRTALEIRLAQHNAGTLGGYTARRRPVTLVYSQWFDRITDAIENERKLKGWSRAKKEALMRGDLEALRQLSARRSSSLPTIRSE